MTKRNRGKKRRISTDESDSDISQVKKNEVCTEQFAKILDKYASKILGDTYDVEPNNTKQIEGFQFESEGVNNAADAKPQKEVEVVVFHSRKKKTRNISKDENEVSKVKKEFSVPKSKYTNERLNSSEVLEKLKFDVGNFGMKAFSKEEQRQQEIKRAVKLGAKPPKRKYMNYKLLMEERKRKQEESKESTNNASSKSNDLQTRQEKSSGLPKFWKQGNKSFSSQIGKYKDGVLKLSSKDIKSVNKRR